MRILPNAEENPEKLAKFTVLDSLTHEPIQGAKVSMSSLDTPGFEIERTTGSDGGCSMQLPVGGYVARITHPDYATQVGATKIGGSKETVNFKIYLTN